MIANNVGYFLRTLIHTFPFWIKVMTTIEKNTQKILIDSQKDKAKWLVALTSPETDQFAVFT